MTGTLICRQPLDNGLVAEFYDLSRLMAGDRWVVKVEVRITIPVHPGTIPPDLASQAEEVVQALGQELLFTKEEVRHFIDVREVPQMVESMVTRLREGLRGYLSHPDFAGRYIRKKYKEWVERQSWYKE